MKNILLASVLIGVIGCDAPEVDELRSEGGAAPDPTGVMTGTVLYVGPRPSCRYEGGAPVEPIGRVILTLFEYDNPPPPAGSATTAENLLTIPGQLLFTDLNDCLPEGATPDPSAPPIMRSIAFEWPEIELARDEERIFQIRGFYDSDADFNPFFAATNQPTHGDVAGGAFVDISASPPQFLPIVFPSAHDAPNGARNDEPTVTLGALVNTERPVFELHPDTMPLSSEAVITATTDPMARESEIWSLTETRFTLFPRTPTAEQQAALDAAGIDFDFGDEQAYAWYIRGIDVNNDGETDPHPILGRNGVPWLSPAVIMRRIQSPAETAAGFPDALLIPSPRPTYLFPGRDVRYPNVDIVVVPVAAVVTNPALPECRIPYIPQGNSAETYRSAMDPIPVECAELPTGNYAVITMHGFAGARFRMQPEISPVTGWIICGSADCPTPSFTGQVWQIPNELGDPTQLGSESAVLPSQGLGGTFLVFDPDTATSGGNDSAECQTSREGDPVDPVAVPEECCAPIVKFCGLPLCDAIPASFGVGASGQSVRGPGRDDDGDGKLDCVPFAMPTSCCASI